MCIISLGHSTNECLFLIHPPHMPETYLASLTKPKQTPDLSTGHLIFGILAAKWSNLRS